MKYKGSYICSKDCPECEGAAYVDGDDIGRFNARTMEIEHDTERLPCPNAEWDYPDYPDKRDDL